MGLLDSQTQKQWYDSSSKGDYQFVSLDNIINAFLLVHVGEDKLINKASRTDVQFHAMRAIQELSYDVFRSIKDQEIEVPSTLRMPLPIDYINYTKVVRVGSDGIERILYPTGKTSNPFAIQQEANGSYAWVDSNNTLVTEDSDEVDGVIITETSTPDSSWSLKEQGTQQNWWNIEDPDTYKPFASDTSKKWTNNVDSDPNAADTVDIELDNLGRRYGLDPQHAQANGTFFIDYRTGFIHFGSNLSGETIILKYISDGLGTDEEMVVHKFCEEACYKWIAYGLLSSRSNIPEYIVQRYKKEKFAETRKAKIRLSNIKMEEFTQVLKGLSKPIK